MCLYFEYEYNINVITNIMVLNFLFMFVRVVFSVPVKFIIQIAF